MTRDQKKTLIERLHGIWNTGDLAAVPHVYSANYVVHWPKSGSVPESRGHRGAEALLSGLKAKDESKALS